VWSLSLGLSRQPVEETLVRNSVIAEDAMATARRSVMSAASHRSLTSAVADSRTPPGDDSAAGEGQTDQQPAQQQQPPPSDPAPPPPAAAAEMASRRRSYCGHAALLHGGKRRPERIAIRFASACVRVSWSCAGWSDFVEFC